ncbi:hypothetical protein [Sterolibacterium denitrificans]|uniref:hypothetical protein n=1 Tax=Sterolibacterium denitrificans TaxID=157592 RepID=UPI0012B67F30|nr:hypothetical protein [Sterolibacterium denitrificans]
MEKVEAGGKSKAWKCGKGKLVLHPATAGAESKAAPHLRGAHSKGIHFTSSETPEFHEQSAHHTMMIVPSY